VPEAIVDDEATAFCWTEMLRSRCTAALRRANKCSDMQCRQHAMHYTQSLLRRLVCLQCSRSLSLCCALHPFSPT